MQHSARLPSAVACCLFACSNPASNDRTSQQFTGTIAIAAQGGFNGWTDAGARFTMPRLGAIDAKATVTPMTDLRFGLGVRFEDGGPVHWAEASLPPTITAHWDGMAPGTYRMMVRPEQEGMPSDFRTFSVSGTITYP